MRFNMTVLAVAMTAVSLTACSKKEETPAAEKKAEASQSAQNPFQRNGELLTVNVDAMPRAAFIAKMAEITGVKITAEGDSNQPVTVHAADASLRKVLSMAIADAPYTANMQYTNLQDSFPTSVVITHYKTGAANQATQPQPALRSLMKPPAQPVTDPVPAQQEEPDRPDLATMNPDEQMQYFLGQPKDEQVSIIFDMEPTAAEAELMTRLMTKEGVSSEVKMEILDSLSNSEYETGAPAIKMALESTDPEVSTKAVEVLAELGSAKDIPALKALGEKTDNEDVRNAVNDAVEALQP